MSQKDSKNKYQVREFRKNDAETLIFLVVCVLTVALVIGGLFILFNKNRGEVKGIQDTIQSSETTPPADPSGKQILNLTAKGGYSPKSQIGKAGTPTILKVATKNTFDCSVALSIPSLGVSKYLPGTGVTDIEIPPQKSGTTLRGSCSMGMYTFNIKFS